MPTKEEIEKRELYLGRGCEPGKALDDWLAAEKELTLETQAERSSARVRKTAKSKVAWAST